MNPSLSTTFPHQRTIQDRRSRPTSFLSALRFGGRRKGFRRKGEGRNRYVDCLSSRTLALTLTIVILSILDVVFTKILLENGATELNPLMAQTVQNNFQFVLILKSLGVGCLASFLAVHQNFKLSFYGMRALAAIHIVLLAYHLMCCYLLEVI